MSEEIEGYENNLELELFKEYRDVIGLFKYVVETERRFYLCNHVDVRSVRVITYKDVNVEELSKPELDIP